ncbi:hypothetical protein L208DRAFT_1412632 [Tricholoma matsutake]|nr:hypothetical protein L208DRAFT_1412632 [Tricholoma matsutake 945]
MCTEQEWEARRHEGLARRRNDRNNLPHQDEAMAETATREGPGMMGTNEETSDGARRHHLLVPHDHSTTYT